MPGRTINAKDLFDDWARDYHADGMEKSHWLSVKHAFELIPTSTGNYLEIGIGNGYGIHYMAENQYREGFCTGLDISPNMIEKAKHRLRDRDNVALEAADFLTWKPPENLKFSCVFSMETFYYFRDIAAGIRKAASLLAPDGILMILVNHYQENEASHSWSKELSTPMTLWTSEQYLSAFRESGLTGLRQLRLSDNDTKAGTLCTIGKRK